MLLLIGQCLTMTERGTAGAVAVDGPRLADVGEAGDLAARYPQATRIRVQCLTPGVHDAHVHPVAWGRSLAELSLAGATDPRAVAARVAESASLRPAGTWVTGAGYMFDGYPPSQLLDAAAPHHPVFLRSRDLHAAWANQAALRAAGIGTATPDPPGGRLLRHPDGTPTGYLLETAAELVARAVPPPSSADLQRGLADLAGRGFTAVHAMAYEGVDALPWVEELAAGGHLPLRVWWALGRGEWRHTSPGWRGEDLDVAAVKLFTDGALGSRTAWMDEPYPDGSHGMLLTPIVELRREGEAALKAGFALAVHAIGTRAVREVAAMFHHLASLARRPLRLEHAQHISSQTLETLAAVPVVASMQPIHLAEDAALIQRLLPGHEGEAFRFRDLATRGVTLAFGSDAPVAPPDIALGIRCATTHPLRPEQSLTWHEAVRGFSCGAATAAGWTDCGVLRAGMRADLAVWEDGRLVGRVWRGQLQWLGGHDHCAPAIATGGR